MISIILWVIAGAFGLLGAIALLGPLTAFFEVCMRVWRSERGGVSTTPILGTILGMAAITICPVGELSERAKWLWAPIALEVTVFGLALLFWRVSGLHQAWEKLNSDHNDKEN